MALHTINITSYDQNATQLMHICAEPRAKSSMTWLGSSISVHSIRSIVFDDLDTAIEKKSDSAIVTRPEKKETKQPSLNVEFGRLHYYEVDLSFVTNHFRLNIINSRGEVVDVTGYCILHLNHL